LKPEVHTIQRVFFRGKWAEVCWKGSDKTEGEWDFCCKGYMLDQLIEDAGIEDDIVNRGWRGIRLVIYHDSHNWEPFCVAAGRDLAISEGDVSV